MMMFIMSPLLPNSSYLHCTGEKSLGDSAVLPWIQLWSEFLPDLYLLLEMSMLDVDNAISF